MPDGEVPAAPPPAGGARRVLVVGAGVIGLTCAVRLAEAGYDIHVLARDLPLETTSAVAAALWLPYRADPPERILDWAATSYAEFTRLAEDHPDSGVRRRFGRELTTTPQPPPWWAPAVPDLAPVDPPVAGYAGGWQFHAPVVDMSVYLPWLAARLQALGGTLTRRALAGLPDRAPIVVNCSGLASRRLAADPSVTPVRGQVVHLEQHGLTEWWVADLAPDRPVYVVPRLHDVVVGGTAEEGDWETRPRPDAAESILAAAMELVPGLAQARVLGHRVALRPARPSVRLEAEQGPGGRLVVHCYGHGGSGVTVSWGCADEVTALVRAHAGA